MSSTITLMGRMTKPAELRFTGKGMAVAAFTIVTSRRVKDADGTWSDADTTFWDCKAFGQLAENLVESLDKGMDVIAQGRVLQESWEDKESGQKRSKMAVVVDEIGPTLRRATAKVSKSSGASSGGGGREAFQQARRQQGQASAEDPWASTAAGQGAPAAGGWGGGDEPPPF